MNTRMRTHTGNSFDFLHIEDNDIHIEDIASGLAKECRFAGQTKEDVFVSVAQHAIIVSYLVPPEVAYEALHHDSSEAYTGDIPTPMKHLLPDFIKMEKRVQKHIYDKLGIAVTNHPTIKEADARVLSMEACFHLAKGEDHSLQFRLWDGLGPKEVISIYGDVECGLNSACLMHNPWSINEARKLFLARHNYLKAEYLAKYKPVAIPPVTYLDTESLRLREVKSPQESLSKLHGGKLTGNHYYRVEVKTPIAPDVKPYVAECADIIEALNMTFNEGEAFKALWRLASGKQGNGKPGSSGTIYDADKVKHYGERVAAVEHAKGQQ